MNAYLHPLYAASLSEFGTPRHLKHSGTWILVRPIEGTTYYDAMGLYPLMCCEDWTQLRNDMDDLRDLVSLTFVTDPFGAYSLRDLAFCDHLVPFKKHYYVDTSRITITPRHTRAAQRALKHVTVTFGSGATPDAETKSLDNWNNLYAHLIDYHNIHGIARFSPDAFQMQFCVPGLLVSQAWRGGQCISMLLWYRQGDVAYYHLGASSPDGYAIGASHALFYRSIYMLKDHVKTISLGGGAGLEEKEDGLTQFKQGYADKIKWTYLGGVVLRPEMYKALGEGGKDGYFPAYRG